MHLVHFIPLIEQCRKVLLCYHSRPLTHTNPTFFSRSCWFFLSSTSLLILLHRMIGLAQHFQPFTNYQCTTNIVSYGLFSSVVLLSQFGSIMHFWPWRYIWYSSSSFQSKRWVSRLMGLAGANPKLPTIGSVQASSWVQSHQCSVNAWSPTSCSWEEVGRATSSRTSAVSAKVVNETLLNDCGTVFAK